MFPWDRAERDNKRLAFPEAGIAGSYFVFPGADTHRPRSESSRLPTYCLKRFEIWDLSKGGP